MSKDELIKDLDRLIKSRIHKIGNDGTRYYLLSLDELVEIINVLEND